MSRRVSLNARQAHDDQSSTEIEVVLFEISHGALEAPIRLSTDNTERLSSDPLTYGTRSVWRGANPASDPYLWIIASAIIPDDTEDAPAASQIVLENLDARMTELLRSFTDQAVVNMAVVLASSPHDIEGEWLDLRLMSAEGDAAQIVLSLSREEIELEHFPSGRMTRHKFPGLHL
ncbi:MAG: hypothetical protein ACRBBS_09870 [Thalassovita sp.]